jgi:hypothetical protein
LGKQAIIPLQRMLDFTQQMKLNTKGNA